MPFLHQSKTVVAAGELLASFPLCLTSGTEEPRKHKVTVVCLHAAAEELVESDYRLSMNLMFEGGEECFSSYFNNIFAVGMTPKTVNERLDAFNQKVEAFYPYMHKLPRVDYEQDGDILGHFLVSLPPFTSIYTTTDGFWDTLGFEEDSYRSFPDVRMKHAPATNVLAYGFTNRTPDTLQVLARNLATNTATLNDVYTAISEPNVSQRTHLEVRYFQDVLPIALAKKRPMNKTLVLDGLCVVLDDALRILGLDPTAVYIEAVGRTLVFKNKEYHRTGAAKDAAAVDARMSVVLKFPTELQEFLQLEVDSLTFPLSDGRSYEVEPREEASYDPLESFYPCTLLLQQGDAKNYVEGRGFTSILAVMRSREDFVGEGAVFFGHCEQLTVRFLDKRLQPVRLRERLTTFILTLELEPLF